MDIVKAGDIVQTGCKNIKSLDFGSSSSVVYDVGKKTALKSLELHSREKGSVIVKYSEDKDIFCADVSKACYNQLKSYIEANPADLTGFDIEHFSGVTFDYTCGNY